MIPCKHYVNGGKYEYLLTPLQRSIVIKHAARLEKDQEFLCPYGMDRLAIRGDFGYENFEYVKIEVFGCSLGAECFPDEQIRQASINLHRLEQHTTLINDNGESNDISNVIENETDVSFFKWLDPEHRQSTNVFYTQSQVIIKKHFMRIFGNEAHVDFIENTGQFDYYKTISKDMPIQDREYL